MSLVRAWRLVPGPVTKLREDGLDIALARALYVEQGLSLLGVAKRLGSTPDKLRVRFATPVGRTACSALQSVVKFSVT